MPHLPPELLVEIFTNLNPFRPCIDSGRMGSIHDLVIASHVCHYWREVALQYSLLWSNIALNAEPDAVAAALTRSEGSELNVSYHACTDNYPMFGQSLNAQLAMLLKELHRVRSLWLPVEFNMLAMATLRAHFPERFRVPHLLAYVEDVSQSLCPHHISTNSDVPESSLLSFLDAPNLMSLHIRIMTAVLWKVMPSHGSLRYLTISDWATRTPTSAPCPPNILRLLKNFPLLETLVVLRLFNHQDLLAAGESCCEVSLPKLRRFKLHGMVRICASLLRHLAFPLSVSMNVEACDSLFDDEPFPQDILDDTLYIVNRVAAGNTDSPGKLSALKVTFNPEQLWHTTSFFHAWTDPENTTYYPLAHHGFGAEFGLPNSLAPFDSIPWDLPVFAARYLCIANMTIDNHLSLQALAVIPSVEDLSYIQGNPQGLNELLANRYNGFCPFPNLHTIRIEDCMPLICSWRPSGSGTSCPVYACRACKIIPSLIHLLRQRIEEAAYVKCIFTDYFPDNLTPSEKHGIRQVVSTLDGVKHQVACVPDLYAPPSMFCPVIHLEPSLMMFCATVEI